MPIEMPPKPELWLPPRPAIVRAASIREANFLPGTFPGPVMASAFLLRLLASVPSTSSTVDVPASVVAGDLLVLADRADANTGTPTYAIPSGFTELQNNNMSQRRQIISYKLAVGGEASSSLSGLSGTAGQRKVLLVFRGTTPIAGITAAGNVGTITDSNPAAQDVLASGGTPPLVVVAAFGSSGYASGEESASPALDAVVVATDRLGFGYKVYNSAPADHNIDIADQGNGNAVQGGYIQCAAA